MPLLIKHVVFFQLGSYVPFVLLYMSAYLWLSFLINFNLKPTLPRPLFSEIFIQLLNRLILKLFYISGNLKRLILFLSKQPGEILCHRLLKNFSYSFCRDYETRMHSLIAIWILRYRLHCLLHIVVNLEFRLLFFYHNLHFRSCFNLLLSQSWINL